MRRPHRSIEVFDISLMAVVTKAMGAFLVMMLLLLPYYSSGPIGQKAADDLAAKVEQINKEIQATIDSLKSASPEDLRERLEQALRELEEARKLIAELKRDNDALNAQVKRLEDDKAALTAQVSQLRAQVASLQQENDTLRKQIADLQAQIDQLRKDLATASQGVLMGQVTDVSCPDDVFLFVGTFPVGGTIIASDKSELKYPLDSIYTLGSWDYGSGTDGKVTSIFSYQGYGADGKYVILAQTRSRTAKAKKHGDEVRLLKKPSAPCSAQLALEVQRKGGVVSLVAVVPVAIDPNNYVSVVGDLAATDKDFTLNSPSAESVSWVQDQLKHADKVP